MTPLFKKLNPKETDTAIVILDAPESFRTETEALGNTLMVKETLGDQKPIDFIVAFVTQQQQVDALATAIVTALQENGILWFCYPKGTSKKYKCDFNRDTGWAALGQHGFEPVRMVAIDEDWSALRFRRVQYIKKLTRKTALSKKGKAKAGTSGVQ